MLGVDLIVWNTGNGSLVYQNYKTVDYSLYLFKTPTKILLDGEEFLTEPYSMIIYESGTSQTFRGLNDAWRFDFVEIAGDEAREVIDALKLPLNTLFQVSDPLYVSSLLKKLNRETIRKYEFRRITLDIMLRELLLKISSMYQKISSGTPPIRDKYVSALKSIRKEILVHPEQDWSVPKMAKTLNLSESYFRKLYIMFHGVAPKDDLINIRIQRAEYLMNCEGLSVRETASAVGYSNEYHFIRIFKKRVGVSPGVFLMNHRGGDVVDN